mmetsp:Transcript_3728/g.8609  ORF Transcript_3728/g.8609 Transcript_3728/m.8609 type:complete len:483 (+) Transcript_3728:255-1703(+)|eukprot:CAMPEP_0169459212 /NCGR_PEP_ID=MMETSP1042-20121227/17840_1 /TAXON_ID=464988 /ORGANISM="Hemiselmis andersenii, Strain CCMP1180" /LENGTH=482 /DNA_ID=CAMNT_0009571635 /DNA_START=237 /DNA_END=1685 /DNA_ORIENTATION=+
MPPATEVSRATNVGISTQGKPAMEIQKGNNHEVGHGGDVGGTASKCQADDKSVPPPKSRWAALTMERWELLVILLTVAPMAGFTVISPYQPTVRAELGCGPVCIGSMTSVSSFVGLFGAPLVGALSDQQGRRFALTLGTLAMALFFVIQGASTSLVGLWLALVPPALLSHNFTITKAIVADLAAVENRAATLGKLGLAAGLGFMCGPVFQLFIKTFTQATVVATLLQIASLWAIYLLPPLEGAAAHDEGGAAGREAKGLAKVFGSVWGAVTEVGELAVAAPASARCVLFLRFSLSMGFHVFYTVMSVILREKFKFGPNDWSNYFAFIGFVYATSQVLSKYFVNRTANDPTRLIMVCAVLMGIGRYSSAVTSSLAVFYVSLTLSILALGIINNSVNTTVTRLGGRDKVGGLMGVLDTSEKLAGVVGPTLGGFLYSYDPFTPVLAVCSGYVVISLGVLWAFPRYLVPTLVASAAEDKRAEKKAE